VVPCQIHFDAPEAIQFAAARAILVGLIVTELVSNAGKYAYPVRPGGGAIWVRVQAQSDERAILVSVRDEGVGLPDAFDPVTSKRLGMRVVNALSSQLGGELTRPASPIGTNFTLLIPMGPTTT
jgi:two-component sensor histidine kinase